MLNRLRLRLRRDQRGAVLVMTIPVLLLAMTATALSVDIGRQVVEKRSDQSVADLAALDAARAIGLLAPATPLSTIQSQAQAAAEASAARNGFGDDPSDTLQAIVGSLDPVTNAFAATGTTAVQVIVGSTIDYVFVPGSKTLSARAVAKVGSPEAAFSVGSALATLDAKKSRLDPMLRGMLRSGSLSAVSYDGLANADLSLRALREQLLLMGLDVGTTDKLLTTELTVVQILTATAQALGQQGEPTAQAEINDLLAANITTTNTVQLGRFVNLSQPASEAALDAGINVFQLVVASAEVANGSSFADVPLAGVNLLGLTGVTLKAKVIEPAQVAIGPVGTSAATSQVTLRLTVDVPLGLLLPTAKVTLDYTAASAQALITEIRCGSAAHGLTLNASTSGVAISGTGVVPTGTMTIFSSLAGTPTSAYGFNHPSEFDPYYRHIGVGTLGLNASSLTVTGDISTAALAPILQGLLPSTLVNVNTALSPAIQPLLASLGLNISAADLTALDIVPSPETCGGKPRLAK